MFSNSNFVHLHNHSEYSTFDGLSPVKNMAAYARMMGFPALALTDHGNIGGILKHLKYCTMPKLEYVDDEGKKHDAGPPIKPIVGCEYYFTKNHREKGDNYHITVLAKNYQGYRNLCMLDDIAFRDGFYRKPRIDFDLLFKYKEGLIVTTGCGSSIVSNQLLKGHYDKAYQTVGMMKEELGDDLYFEVMYHGLKMEKLILKDQLKLARKHDLCVVATNDNHYILKDHAKSHEVFLAMNSKKCIKDPTRMRFSYPEFYIKSGQEMYDIWKEIPESLHNTVAVAEKVNSKEIMDNLYGGMKIPKFDVPENHQVTIGGLSKEEQMFKESYSYLEELAQEGLEKLGWHESQSHIEALDRELADIKVAWTSNRYDFATYMLIVWDIIKWAKENGVEIAAGRGSGYGSVLLRTLKICYGPDPLEYGLLWERFLGFDDIRFVSSIDFGLEITNKSIKIPDKSTIIKEIREAILDKFQSKEDVERWKLEMKDLSSTEGLDQQNNLKAMYYTWKGVEGQTGNSNRINSLTAYLLGMTTEKPDLNSNFMESRRAFARAGFPDIDTDLDDENRHKIFDYLIEKYGEECVANIGTYSTLKLRSAVTRTMKALDIADAFHKGPELFKSENERMVREVLGSLPGGADIKVYDGGDVKKLKTISECKQYFKHFKYYIDKYPDIEFHCNNIQGLLSSFGVHAAGVVIANEPIGYIAPVRPGKQTTVSSESGEMVKKSSFTTQYDYPDLESIGLIKFDFLAIATLSVIQNTKKLIKDNYGFDLDVEKIPVDDQKTLDLYNTGNLSGVFQCENNGMQQAMVEVGADSFADIMAVVALYRPGPMENIPTYSNRKKGLQKVDYFHPSLEEFVSPYLKKTYGILVYQEQIMQVLQSIAGFSSTEGYMMIKAVGKKKPELMPPIETKFVSGAVANGVPKSVASEYWHKILMPFADYGFNASHACGYGYVSFQTAYLKAHYPEEFFCALLNSINVRKDFDKMAIVAADLKNFDIKLRENDINLSSVGYNVIKKKDLQNGIKQSEIAPSLMCKGVGKSPAADIAKHKPYANLRDLALKTNSKIVNSGAISSLHENGYLDSILSPKQSRMNREDLILDFNESRNAIKKAKKKGIDPSESIF